MYLCLFLLLAMPALAQAPQKYGHIDSYEVVSRMPEFQTLNRTLQSREKQYKARLKKEYLVLSDMQQDVQQYGAGLMTAVMEQLITDGAAQEQKISKLETEGPIELETYKSKMLRPINARYLKAVQQVSKELGYTFIFDLSKDGVVYYPEETGDVGPLVKKKLGI
jgi:outer membrane protein